MERPSPRASGGRAPRRPRSKSSGPRSPGGRTGPSLGVGARIGDLCAAASAPAGGVRGPVGAVVAAAVAAAGSFDRRRPQQRRRPRDPSRLLKRRICVETRRTGRLVGIRETTRPGSGEKHAMKSVRRTVSDCDIIPFSSPRLRALRLCMGEIVAPSNENEIR